MTEPATAATETESKSVNASTPPAHSRRRRILVRVSQVFGVVLVAWLLLAYVVIPLLFRHYEHHPALEDAPKTTVTAQGIPGDPLNVAFVGHEAELVHAMIDSGWDPADPVTLRSSLHIARSVLLDRPYLDAPVSPLFVFGRKQDLAFEKPFGMSAKQRHHVRFWKAPELGRAGAPLWIGAITFDKSVGLSHRTGQITHHIDADIDAERDGLMNDLRTHGWLTELFQVTGVGQTLVGRNGGGDPYYTDGELTVGILAPSADRSRHPDTLANPIPVQIKQQLWSAIRPLLDALPGS